jgi:hypothetical protein
MSKPKYLIVEAGVRYWEDATVNGVEDKDGSLIPFRSKGTWNPTIEIETGLIRDWPQGTSASVHYKVCDSGSYLLAEEDGNRVMQIIENYVPRCLCPLEEGYGDYIIMKIDGEGRIEGWNEETIENNEWEEVQ